VDWGLARAVAEVLKALADGRLVRPVWPPLIQSDTLAPGRGNRFKRFLMRPLILSASLITGVLSGGIQAALAQSPTSYPWCATYYKDGTPTSCYFTSYQQCRASVSGVGGVCFESPYYHSAPGAVRRRHR
jgi:hypothetical protein